MFRTLALAFAVCVAGAAHAQTTTTLRGIIVAAADDTLTFKTRAGETVKVVLSPKTRLLAVLRASKADLKPDAFVGVAAVPDKDDTLRALEIHIFPESMRGTGEGTRAFDLGPKSSMTNGALSIRVAGVDGDNLTVNYKTGEKKIRLAPDTPIVAIAAGAHADLVPDAAAIVRGAKGEDGTVEATMVLVGKDGIVPPM